MDRIAIPDVEEDIGRCFAEIGVFDAQIEIGVLRWRAEVMLEVHRIDLCDRVPSKRHATGILEQDVHRLPGLGFEDEILPDRIDGSFLLLILPELGALNDDRVSLTGGRDELGLFEEIGFSSALKPSSFSTLWI